MEVITVANNKGGVGKTMQCYQLACHLANKGKKVLVIDLDSQANLSSTFGVQVQRTLIPEWLIGDVGIDELIIPSEGIGEFHQNISIIPSSRHLANLSKLLILSEGDIRREAGRKERLLRLRLTSIEKDTFDYVVIDTPPVLGDELIMSLVASKRIFIPTQAQDYSIDGLEELLDTFEIIKDSDNMQGILTTGDYMCPKCDCVEVYAYLEQTRSSDEPETRMLTCKDCGNGWREY